MELGHFPPPGEKKIVLIAEILEQNTDELLALAGKVSSDLIEIILQRPKEIAALLRRLRHAPAKKIAAVKDGLTAAEPLEFYPLETVSRENHTAVVGEIWTSRAGLATTRRSPKAWPKISRNCGAARPCTGKTESSAAKECG